MTFWLFVESDFGANNSTGVDGIFITADVDVVHTARVEPLNLERLHVVPCGNVLKDLC